MIKSILNLSEPYQQKAIARFWEHVAVSEDSKRVLAVDSVLAKAMAMVNLVYGTKKHDARLQHIASPTN